jgi:hypothetical protein
MKPRQPVRLKKGQTVTVDAGRGATIEVERYESGAVDVRNASTGMLLRQFTPKEARG